jgi:hypothetical protein
MKRPLLIFLSLVAWSSLVACGGGSSASPGGGASPPTVMLSESAQTIQAGGSVTLTWSSANATACTASANPTEPDWSGSQMTSGSQTVTPAAASGTVSYMLTCTGGGGQASGVASLAVQVGPLKIVTTALPSGVTGFRYYPHCLQFHCRQVQYGFQLVRSGGVSPFAWSWTAATGSLLPPGLTLSPGGLLGGIPALAGTYNVVVSLSDSESPVAQATANLALFVHNPPPPSITTVTPPVDGVNLPYNFTFQARGGLPPLSWSENGMLPPGLTFSSTGVLSGTPTATGSFPITVTVEDALLQSSGPQNFTVQISLHGFTAAARMATARQAHTATLLANGKVLVAGGLDNIGSESASAELFDPAGGTFASTGSMQTPRQAHTATLLNNGKVLVTGGGIAPTATAELFDPTTGMFATTGTMHTARSSHTATLLNDGKVLITGGGTNTTELFDPSTGTFTLTGNMSTPRTFHTATLLASGKVLVAGGFGSDGSGLATAELFDETSGTFAATGNMVTAHFAHTATLLNGGKVLIAGGLDLTGSAGATAELFDPVAGTFSATGSMANPRQLHTATLLNDGTVLIAGGLNSNTISAAELFDPTTGTFSSTGAMTAVRAAHTATLLGNATVLVTGGRNENSTSQSTSDLYQ